LTSSQELENRGARASNQPLSSSSIANESLQNMALQGSGNFCNNLNSSIKKVADKASALRASTGRSNGGGGNIPGADTTKGSSNSTALRKSGGSQSTRKQSATNYINKNKLIDSQQRKSMNMGTGSIEGDALLPLSSNSTFTNDGLNGPT